MTKVSKAKFTKFRPRIRSRHPSHDVLREHPFPLRNYRSIIRLGSSTETKDQMSSGGGRIELNTVEAIANSSDKLKMKQCFTKNEVTTAEWFIYNNQEGIFNLPDGEGIPKNDLPYPIVAKHRFGSRGRGNTLINNQEALEDWLKGKTLSNYIFEKFHNYNREYRLHVNEDGCFYTCRKMLKSDTPEKDRWFRNDTNSVWIVEENEDFDKPVNWDSVVEQSVKALKSVGLHFGAVDLRIQSRINSEDKVRKDPKFIIVEINSAPSFGEITSQKYIEEIPKMLDKEYDRYKKNKSI